MSDPSLRLVRAIAECAEHPVTLVDARCTEWTTTTFSGHRHVIRFDANADERFSDALDPDGFALPGHVLAEIAVTERAGGRVTIRALSIRVDGDVCPGGTKRDGFSFSASWPPRSSATSTTASRASRAGARGGGGPMPIRAETASPIATRSIA